jgi:hypothetical protein
MLAPGHGPLGNERIRLQVIPLLPEANAMWALSSSNDPRYAESLTLLAILLRSAAEIGVA